MVASRRILVAAVLGSVFSFGRSRLAFADTEPPRLTLFLSCPRDCFDDYLRQELSYFDFARDPHLADYQLVIVRQPSSDGGERFTVTLETRQPGVQPSAPDTETFPVGPGVPTYDARQRLAQAILRMLERELEGTPYERAFELSLPQREGITLSALHDPWDYWVIAPEARGSGEGGSGYYFAELISGLTLRRVTELSKLRIRGEYTQNWSSYRLEDGSRVYGKIYGWGGRTMYAHSLGERSALGGVAVARGSEFENLDAHLHGGPLAEFNFFPYQENARQQLRVAYQVGAWANWYIEVNSEGLFREVHPYHALSLVADANQTWGSVQWVGQANSFIDDPKLYRLSTGAIISLRLFEGLAFNVEGEAALVRDQINLRQREVTDLELLLWTVEQPTEYTFDVQVSLSYTFGSKHDTIVNPRFARVDLEEE